MPNPYLTNLADLQQLEARLDQRLALISKAETNLKGLFEALRLQVGDAYPVLEDLKKTLPLCRQQVDEAKLNGMADRIEMEMAGRLHESLDLAKDELRGVAGPLRQEITAELRTVVVAIKSEMEAMKPAPPDATEAAAALTQMADAFREEARATLDTIRQSMLDQLDLLQSDARLHVDPILSQLTASQSAAEAQIKGAVEAQERALQQRVQQLTRSVDEIATVMEERLTQRVVSMQKRATDKIAATEPILQSRINRSLEQAHLAADVAAEKLQTRLDAIRPRLDEQLNDADRHLLERLKRMDEHASAMSSYLEQKLSSHVEELIQRLRLKLQQEIAAVTGTASPMSRAEPTIALARPKLEVEVFVNKRQDKPVAA